MPKSQIKPVQTVPAGYKEGAAARTAMRDTLLREELAALAHEQWSGWMRYMLGKCQPFYGPGDDEREPPGGMLIPAAYFVALNRQMTTAYADLSEAEKDGDRAEADRVLALIGGKTTVITIKVIDLPQVQEALDAAIAVAAAAMPYRESDERVAAALDRLGQTVKVAVES